MLALGMLLAGVLVVWPLGPFFDLVLGVLILSYLYQGWDLTTPDHSR